MTLDNAPEKKNDNFGFNVFFRETSLILRRHKRIIVEIIFNFKIKTNY